MGLEWVLFIFMFKFGAVSAEFPDKASCEVAAKQVSEEALKGWDTVRTFCIQRGGKKV